jgi:hypothetical protein
MPLTNHFEPLDLMAYLDGELPADRAVEAASHLDQCTECRSLARDFKTVSQSLAEWEIEPAGPMLSRPHMPAVDTVKAPRRRWFGLPRWAWATSGVCAAVLAVLVMRSPRPSPDTLFQREKEAAMDRPLGRPTAQSTNGALPPMASPQPGTAGKLQGDAIDAISGPMIARTAELTLTTRDFDQIRARLETILKRHSGYFGELNVSTPVVAGRTLQGKLQFPADQMDSAISEIKQLGHTDSESQSGEDVTSQYVDLDARLSNARHTEGRILDVLRDRTGKLSDVIEAEQELGRVRGEIEQMEAQKRGMLKRVNYSTLTLTVNEEYKKQLQVADSLSMQFRNAGVDGLRSMAGSLMAVALFAMSSGPLLLLWAAILFFPARYAWRRWRARR